MVQHYSHQALSTMVILYFQYPQHHKRNIKKNAKLIFINTQHFYAGHFLANNIFCWGGQQVGAYPAPLGQRSTPNILWPIQLEIIISSFNFLKVFLNAKPHTKKKVPGILKLPRSTILNSALKPMYLPFPIITLEGLHEKIHKIAAVAVFFFKLQWYLH